MVFKHAKAFVFAIPTEKRETAYHLSLGDKEVIKTLGLLWYPVEDCFKIWLHFSDIQTISTKRQVLSAIVSIFDPIGLVGPVFVKAKIFKQCLWEVKSNKSDKKSLH